MSLMTACAHADAAAMPGYRRVIRIEPRAGAVRAMLEDDLHCMAVELRHDGARVAGVTTEMDRAPWTTCPGAEAVLVETFAGVSLRDVTARRDRQRNCTHLHDLAVFAAAHAHDPAPSEYAVAVSDPAGGERILEIRRDGVLLHRWIERDGILATPSAVAGLSLFTLRDWIAGLAGAAREAARMLQWAGLVAHGRTLSAEQRHAALGHRPSCHTMQPERVGKASPLGVMRDFSQPGAEPLAGMRQRNEFELGTTHRRDE